MERASGPGLELCGLYSEFSPVPDSDGGGDEIWACELEEFRRAFGIELMP